EVLLQGRGGVAGLRAGRCACFIGDLAPGRAGDRVQARVTATCRSGLQPRALAVFRDVNVELAAVSRSYILLGQAACTSGISRGLFHLASNAASRALAVCRCASLTWP